MRKNDNIEKSGKMSLLLYTRDGPRSSPLPWQILQVDAE